MHFFVYIWSQQIWCSGLSREALWLTLNCGRSGQIFFYTLKPAIVPKLPFINSARAQFCPPPVGRNLCAQQFKLALISFFGTWSRAQICRYLCSSAPNVLKLSMKSLSSMRISVSNFFSLLVTQLRPFSHFPLGLLPRPRQETTQHILTYFSQNCFSFPSFFFDLFDYQSLDGLGATTDISYIIIRSSIFKVCQCL